MKKTIEVNRGFETQFEDFLRVKELKSDSCTLSNGDKFWEMEIKDVKLLNEIKSLPYIYKVEDTMFFYPS